MERQRQAGAILSTAEIRHYTDGRRRGGDNSHKAGRHVILQETVNGRKFFLFSANVDSRLASDDCRTMVQFRDRMPLNPLWVNELSDKRGFHGCDLKTSCSCEL